MSAENIRLVWEKGNLWSTLVWGSKQGESGWNERIYFFQASQRSLFTLTSGCGTGIGLMPNKSRCVGVMMRGNNGGESRMWRETLTFLELNPLWLTATLDCNLQAPWPRCLAVSLTRAHTWLTKSLPLSVGQTESYWISVCAPELVMWKR